MIKYRRRGYYCKVCREWKAHREFSQTGISRELCVECEELSLPERNERQRINHVKALDTKLRLTKDEWDALRKYARSRTYPALKSFAAEVLAHKREMQALHLPAVEKISFSDLKEFHKNELRERLYDDFMLLVELTPGGPTVRMVNQTEKDILKRYIHHTHLQVIPDDEWRKMSDKTMAEAAADYKEGTGVQIIDRTPLA